ncbi:hypothetical protein C8Q78DRAFT_1938 [Trametes maxima]|nr:hypothetical protein C8Q78DRAFT_1938 [Trametes maxima]
MNVPVRRVAVAATPMTPPLSSARNIARSMDGSPPNTRQRRKRLRSSTTMSNLTTWAIPRPRTRPASMLHSTPRRSASTPLTVRSLSVGSTTAGFSSSVSVSHARAGQTYRSVRGEGVADAGHARWLKDLRSKLQEVQVISEQMRCRKAKLAEGAQVEALLLQSQADCSVVDHRRPSITVTARLPLAPVNNTLLETTSSGTQPEGAQQLEHASCLPLAPVKIVQQKAEAGPFSVPGEDVQLLASCPPLTPADTTPSEATQTRFSRVDPTGSPPLTLVNAAQPESAWQQPTNLPSAPAIDVPLEETQPRHRVVESDGAHLTARPPSAPESIAQPEGTPTLCSSVQPEPAERPPVVLAKSPQLVKALERYSSVNAQSGNAWIYPAPRRLPILPIPASTVQLEETQAHRSGVQPEHPAPPPLPPRRARPGPEANTASLPCSDPLQASETPGVRHSVISGRRCGAIVPGARQHDIYSFCTAARADSGSLCVAHAEEYCSVVERRKVAIEEYYALMADVSLVRRNASSIRTHCANRSASRDIAQDIEQVRRYVAALERVAQCEKRISLLGKHGGQNIHFTRTCFYSVS